MTVPALPDDCSGPRPLCDYEPEHARPARWSSLRPATGPQLRLVPPLPAHGAPPVAKASLARVLRHVLEVLDGRRPVAQLRSLLDGPVFEAMLTRLRTTRSGGRHVLRSIHTCFPSDTAVEVAVVFDRQPPSGRPRVRAAAARFEYDDGRWLCTVLRFL